MAQIPFRALLIVAATVCVVGMGCRSDGLPEDDLAEKLLLREDDFESREVLDFPEQSDLAEACRPEEPPGIEGAARAGLFTNGGIGVTQHVVVFEGAAPANVIDRVPSIGNCMAAGINRGEADTSDATFSDAFFQKVRLPCVGDRSAAFRLGYVAETEDNRYRYFADTHHVNAGRFSFQIAVQYRWDPLPYIIAEDWIGVTIERARDAEPDGPIVDQDCDQPEGA